MVDIALDPNMYYFSMSTADSIRKAGELGYKYVELSPNEEFHFWQRYPKGNREFIEGLRKAEKESGVRVRTINPVQNWSSPDERERGYQVRNWRRIIELADMLDVREIVSEFSGNPNTPRECEQAWFRSIEELAPDFEKYGIRLNMEAHPYDYIETHDEAYRTVAATDKDWIGYEFCCPHTFHLSSGVGDVERMITSSAPKLREVHVADTFNHLANDGNRYIINPPGVDARVHQHNAIGNGEVPWDRVFSSLRGIHFDGVLSVCIFGWHEWADELNKKALARLRSEFAG
ncbi:sugar phosphate isomerase/epimerase [Acidipropionibacterium acidipropionici]|uniref:Protein iolH n=1 Tax=Acidipropionibacterium acidipropionici TaxID=1748 RepID=A0AAC9ANK1_9ACTN|nr:sugar phosphate isomerase/epimerase [Acidipropionibacterium acidipropionici]AMS05740.1 protein iolH [Acidipropionibacterium acidipropionici]AOZ47207.1 protein iolH [Acidipropionibacterium acidipropionici]AZP36685.1 sugar phosphate isomerase/epimerase [Acidipropionibacterium acidipropionici]